MSADHAMHLTQHLLEKTAAGHKVTQHAVSGMVAAANVVGGAALASVAAVAAPIVVPVAIVGAVGYFVMKLFDSH